MDECKPLDMGSMSSVMKMMPGTAKLSDRDIQETEKSLKVRLMRLMRIMQSHGIHRILHPRVSQSCMLFRGDDPPTLPLLR